MCFEGGWSIDNEHLFVFCFEFFDSTCEFADDAFQWRLVVDELEEQIGEFLIV